jgi:hypothetical protein
MSYKLVRYRHGHSPQEAVSGNFEEILSWCASKNLIRVHKDTVYTQFVAENNFRLLGSSINLFRGPHPKHDYYRVVDADKFPSKNKKLPEEILENSGVKSWSGGGWSIAFFYSSAGNFVIKGYLKELEDKMHELKNSGIKYLVNITIWSSGVHRSIWKTSERNIYIYEPSKKRKKWEIIKYEEGEKKSLRFRRLPKKLVPEIEEFLIKYK